MKYKLTSETKEVWGVTLHRIEALKDFANVMKGEKGGWIEKEDNLSQDGNCWVYGDAEVSRDARVYGDAEVSGNAWVSGNARVYGDAEVSGNARVYGDAEVSGDARVSSGYCFAYTEPDWDITEIPSGDGVLLIRDYEEPEEEPEVREYSMDEVAEALGVDVKELKIKKE